jgi:hypothetical protein
MSELGRKNPTVGYGDRAEGQRRQERRRADRQRGQESTPGQEGEADQTHEEEALVSRRGEQRGQDAQPHDDAASHRRPGGPLLSASTASPANTIVNRRWRMCSIP